MWLVVFWDLLRPNPSLFLRLRVRKNTRETIISGLFDENMHEMNISGTV